MPSAGAVSSILGAELGLCRVAAAASAVVVACAFIQRIFRRELERDQYYYLRDICLIASWAICGIWTQSAPMKLTITAGVVAGLVGFCQKVVRGWDLRFCYIAIGFAVALLTPRIAFIGHPAGEFTYLPNNTAIMILSTLWISFFPILFQEIDEVPGMGGGFLLVSWVLMTVVVTFSVKAFSDAVIMSLCGVALICVFWSRHVNVYRRLGQPLAAMWGALFAGTSILGSSRGVAFAPVIVLPLGLFAIPIAETLLSVFSAAFLPKPAGGMMFYRSLVSRGIEHPTAVFCVTAVCAVCGVSAAVLQMGVVDPLSLSIALVLIALGSYVARAGTRKEADNMLSRPSLWGVAVDSFSVDYALSRVTGWLDAKAPAQMIVTPDALAALRSRSDKKYAKIVGEAGMVIPDGTGLLWALRFLGFSVRERIPGVEFTEHLCKAAASRGWPVYFLGSAPGVAVRASRKLEAKYPGLITAGARDGYFKPEESEAICAEIKAAGARIVFVALGAPKQEYWIAEHMASMGSVVAMGIGGSLDVISGRLKRAPRIWRDMRLEWLYRTIQEPSRWRRVIKLPLFVLLVLMKKAGFDTWCAAQ